MARWKREVTKRKKESASSRANEFGRFSMALVVCSFSDRCRIAPKHSCEMYYSGISRRALTDS